MADYYGTTLCHHPFAVVNPNKFERILRRYGLRKESEGNDGRLWYDKDNEDRFGIYGYASLYLENDGESVEINEVIQSELADHETAVFIEVGTTKCRYDESTGFAIIITKDEVRYISLHDWVEAQLKDIRNKDFHVMVKNDVEN